MLLKPNIFDSNSELKVYKQLQRTWAGKVGIKDHTPVANVINIKALKSYKVKKIEYLWKTNFDFVIASEEDETFGKPLLIIEFDGIGEGYSNYNEYKQIKEKEDFPYRKLKLNLKARVCKEAGVPLVIISYPELRMIDEKLSIIDGIIGEVLFNQEFIKRFYEDISILNEKLYGIRNPEDIQQQVDVYGSQIEIEEKIRNNPIAREANRLLYLLTKNGIINTPGHSNSIEDNYIICEFSVYMQTGKQLSEKVIMRDVNCEGFFVDNLILDIAQLLLLRKIADEHEL